MAKIGNIFPGKQLSEAWNFLIDVYEEIPEKVPLAADLLKLLLDSKDVDMDGLREFLGAHLNRVGRRQAHWGPRVSAF